MATETFEFQLTESQKYFNRSTNALFEADSNFRPSEGVMTAAQQVAHAAQTIEWFIEGVVSPSGFDLDFSKHEAALAAVTSLTAARKDLDTAYSHAFAFVRSRKAEDWSKPLPPGPVMGGQPLSDVIWGIIDHTAHHRGALTIYTRILGRVPPMPYAD